MTYEQGRILQWNLFLGGQLSISSPVRVVEHTPKGLMLWLEAGWPVWRVELPEGGHLRDIPPHVRPVGGFPVKPDHWRLGNALIYQPEGSHHAVWWLFSPDQEFQGWYVNLEYRGRRGSEIDIRDLELDIRVDKDRSWRWKDEESFEAKTGTPGHWTGEEARMIRAEGRRVIESVEAKGFPFDGSWCDFRPNSSWEAPPLPPEPITTAPFSAPAAPAV